ncbi:hypothetical protein L6164_010199 [Bauhinia variegata]|uniref:Uncharacterized protein n=1 Tax=Bauhinia variegata TaxID=167791 RepID=A0ACB9PLB7_BAUVA|nr:hypothetical protein L6164_010199 [Bauhinia variegata]
MLVKRTEILLDFRDQNVLGLMITLWDTILHGMKMSSCTQMELCDHSLSVYTASTLFTEGQVLEALQQ